MVETMIDNNGITAGDKNILALIDSWEHQYALYQSYLPDILTLNSGTFKTTPNGTSSMKFTAKVAMDVKIRVLINDNGGLSTRVRINNTDLNVGSLGVQEFVRRIEVGDQIEWYSIGYYSSVIIIVNPV